MIVCAGPGSAQSGQAGAGPASGGLSAEEMQAAMRSVEDETDAAAAAALEQENAAELAEFTLEPASQVSHANFFVIIIIIIVYQASLVGRKQLGMCRCNQLSARHGVCSCDFAVLRTFPTELIGNSTTAMLWTLLIKTAFVSRKVILAWKHC